MEGQGLHTGVQHNCKPPVVQKRKLSVCSRHSYHYWPQGVASNGLSTLRAYWVIPWRLGGGCQPPRFHAPLCVGCWKFRQVGQLPLLFGRPVQGMGDGFVVSPDCEFTSLQQETKVADCQKGGQQLSALYRR
jgi:hypothetical protein